MTGMVQFILQKPETETQTCKMETMILY